MGLVKSDHKLWCVDVTICKDFLEGLNDVCIGISQVFCEIYPRRMSGQCYRCMMNSVKDVLDSNGLALDLGVCHDAMIVSNRCYRPQ